MKDDLQVVWKQAQQVEIDQRWKEDKVWTTADTVEEFLKEQEIEVTNMMK